MTKLVIIVIAGIMLVSCGNSQQKEVLANNLESLNWLLGKWSNSSPAGVVSEEWKNRDGNGFTGTGCFVKGTDTLSKEKLSLEYIDGVLYYIPTVQNQNDGKAVRFKLTEMKENSLVFENPEHDFPQVISYQLVRPDSMVAEISGTINGEFKKQSYPYTKIK